MPPLKQGREHGIKLLQSYPLIDPETKEPIRGIVKTYFDAKLNYLITGKNKDATPVGVTGFRAAFSDYRKPMSPDVARNWIFSALSQVVNPVPYAHEMHLEELVLGTESKGLGKSEVHTLRAKGHAYCYKLITS